ncbi:MAG: alpha/beta fold hydrolase [Rubrivivax sp.]|jgi:pimeloyl-ACP methyl ester carboxylesterase
MEMSWSTTGTHGQPLSWWVRPARQPVAVSPPVLLIHGLASNASRFEEFVETTRLSEHHRLIRVDLRGHGRALSRGPVGLQAWCDDIVEVLQAEGGQPALLVGHSLGAQVALQMAQRHPRWVSALVLIDPVFRRALHGRSRRIALAAPLWRLMAAAARALNTLGLHRGPLPPLDLRALDRQARAALATPEAEAAFIAQYSSTRADLRHVPTAVYLEDMVAMCEHAPLPRNLGLPTLALMSSGATFADAGQMQEALAGPNVTVEAIDCHHWPLTERPAEVCDAIERWCHTHWPPPSPAARG